MLSENQLNLNITGFLLRNRQNQKFLYSLTMAYFILKIK